MDCGKLRDFFRKQSDNDVTIKVKIGNDGNEANQKSKPWNRVKTSKYTLLTFLPMTIFGQLIRIANFYFLVITIITYFLEDSPISPTNSLIPLIIVVLIAVLKQAREDIMRYRADKLVNERIVTVIRNGKGVDIQGQYIAPGELVVVKENAEIPCDLVILQTTDQHNRCSVTTVNLDGESNLKILYVPKGFPELPFDAWHDLGEIECESPKTDLYHFSGKINLSDQVLPLSTDNLLMRGAVIKNTDEAIGCAVYLGMQTKSQLNSPMSSHKKATSEAYLNLYLFTFVILMILCVTLLYLMERHTEFSWIPRMVYFGPPLKMNSGKEFFNDYFTLLIMFNFMIPISMYGTLEVFRGVGILFLRSDQELYDEEIDEPCIVRTSNLNEELGQIDILFSDKTGTLTKNEMIFKQCSINGQKYIYQGTRLENSESKEINDIHFFNNHQRDFFEALAICHTVVAAHKNRPTSSILVNRLPYETPNTDEDLATTPMNPQRPDGLMRFLSQEHQEEIQEIVHELDYQSVSSDEKALVEACARLGLVYLGDANEVLRLRVIPPHTNNNSKRPQSIGENRGVSYERLNILEFTADRKRMSVIVKDWKGVIWIYTKGADTVILPLCTQASKEAVEVTQRHVNEFACDGLRTLVIARRQLTKSEYREFFQQLQMANDCLDRRQQELIEKCYEFVERDLELLGATAVEDILQDGVAETLEALKKANIRTWVLTGDKVETAFSISLSCGHLSQESSKHWFVDCTELAQVMQRIQALTEDLENGKECALLIDGKTLRVILAEAPKEFRALAIKCESVLCCRLSPIQKSKVVALMKASKKKFITAAIGDGANDVSMIQEAHVGIGIIGKEGRQAAMSSNYSIGKFRMLQRLLFVHGHYNTARLACMVMYYFYENILVVAPMFIFQFYCWYSGTTLFDSLFLGLYTTVYNLLGIVFLSFTEKPYSEELLMNDPKLYNECRRYKPLNVYNFSIWMLKAVYQAVIIYYFAYVLFDSNNVILNFGRTADFSCFGTLIMQCVVLVSHLTLLISVRYITRFFMIGWSIGIIIFLISTIIYNAINHVDDPSLYWTYFYLLASLPQWLFSIVTIIACMLPIYVVRYYIEGFKNNREKFNLFDGFWCCSKQRLSRSDIAVLMS